MEVPYPSFPKKKPKRWQTSYPQIPKSPSNHFENFLLACNGIEKTRSPFEINGVLSQVFSLGVMAQRLNTQLVLRQPYQTNYK